MVKKQRGPDVLEEILKLKHAQPFKPFELRTADGQTFVIMKGERIGRSPSGRVISFYARGEPGDRMMNVADVIDVRPVRPKRHPRSRSGR